MFQKIYKRKMKRILKDAFQTTPRTGYPKSSGCGSIRTDGIQGMWHDTRFTTSGPA